MSSLTLAAKSKVQTGPQSSACGNDLANHCYHGFSDSGIEQEVARKLLISARSQAAEARSI
eukprot:12925498-Prorocentrum_lima.AAC.1